MKFKRTIVVVGIVDVLLFLISANLSIFLTLISADLVKWYEGNHTLVLVITGALIIGGSILVIAKIWLSSKKENNMIQDNATKFLKVVYEAHRGSPGDPIHSEKIRKQLGLSEETAIDLIKKLEQREFLKAEWLGTKALLSITDKGVILFTENQ